MSLTAEQREILLNGPGQFRLCARHHRRAAFGVIAGWRGLGSVLDNPLQIERDPEDDALSRSSDYLVSFDACLRLPAAVGSLGTGGDHHQGHGEQLR